MIAVTLPTAVTLPLAVRLIASPRIAAHVRRAIQARCDTRSLPPSTRHADNPQQQRCCRPFRMSSSAGIAIPVSQMKRIQPSFPTRRTDRARSDLRDHPPDRRLPASAQPYRPLPQGAA